MTQPTTQKSWEQQFFDCLDNTATRVPADFIEDMAALAFAVPEAEGDAFLDRDPTWRAHRPAITKLYYEHIVAMETHEIRHLLGPIQKRGLNYEDVATEKGLISYLRVADMFEYVDFKRCRRFVMVGCGQLPVTALHVMTRTAVTDMVLLDVSEAAIEAVERLRTAYGWDALQPRLCSGKDYDFSSADVVYVGNMVSPKLKTLQRVLATASSDVQIVMREPYSLGRTWAEKAEGRLPRNVQVVGRGSISRHLSRDLYIRLRNR